jgi:nitroimidazol reductase NimA-like FMN-containing flavoprotein (pyridoxamine 5'-phosphate oxidase superfamily)
VARRRRSHSALTNVESFACASAGMTATENVPYTPATMPAAAVAAPATDTDIGSSPRLPIRCRRADDEAEGAAVREMTEEEREAFLARPWIAVLSVADQDGRAPLSLPVWYAYQPGGEVTVIAPADSRRVALLRAAGRASLVVQRTAPPGEYVYVEGSVAGIREPATDAERLDLARRYLDASDAERYVRSSAEETARMAVIRVKPEHWLSQHVTDDRTVGFDREVERRAFGAEPGHDADDGEQRANRRGGTCHH